jgi:hypothetical protein
VSALLASSVSFWDVIWWMIVFFVWVMWIFVVIWCFIDNFRRRDHSGWAKALWTLFIIFMPIIGVVSYLVTRPTEEVVVV